MADKPQEAIEDEGLTFLQKEAKRRATEDLLFQQHREKYPEGKPAADTLRATPDPHAENLRRGSEISAIQPHLPKEVAPHVFSPMKLVSEEIIALGALAPLLRGAARHPFMVDEAASGARSLGWESSTPEAITWLARGLTHYGGQLAGYGGEVAERARKAVMGTPGKNPVKIEERFVQDIYAPTEAPHISPDPSRPPPPFSSTPPSEDLKLALESGQPAPLPKEADEGAWQVSGLPKKLSVEDQWEDAVARGDWDRAQAIEDWQDSLPEHTLLLGQSPPPKEPPVNWQKHYLDPDVLDDHPEWADFEDAFANYYDSQLDSPSHTLASVKDSPRRSIGHKVTASSGNKKLAGEINQEATSTEPGRMWLGGDTESLEGEHLLKKLVDKYGENYNIRVEVTSPKDLEAYERHGFVPTRRQRSLLQYHERDYKRPHPPPGKGTAAWSLHRRSAHDTRAIERKARIEAEALAEEAAKKAAEKSERDLMAARVEEIVLDMVKESSQIEAKEAARRLSLRESMPGFGRWATGESGEMAGKQLPFIDVDAAVSNQPAVYRAFHAGRHVETMLEFKPKKSDDGLTFFMARQRPIAETYAPTGGQASIIDTVSDRYVGRWPASMGNRPSAVTGHPLAGSADAQTFGQIHDVLEGQNLLDIEKRTRRSRPGRLPTIDPTHVGQKRVKAQLNAKLDARNQINHRIENAKYRAREADRDLMRHWYRAEAQGQITKTLPRNQYGQGLADTHTEGWNWLKKEALRPQEDLGTITLPTGDNIEVPNDLLNARKRAAKLRAQAKEIEAKHTAEFDELSEDIAALRKRSMEQPSGRGILDLYVKMEKPYVIDAKGGSWDAIEVPVYERTRPHRDPPTTGPSHLSVHGPRWPGFFPRGSLPLTREGRAAGARNHRSLGLTQEDPLQPEAYTPMKTRAIAAMAYREGYDGVVIKNVVDTAAGESLVGDVLIGFDPLKLKLTENIGIFSRRNPYWGMVLPLAAGLEAMRETDKAE